MGSKALDETTTLGARAGLTAGERLVGKPVLRQAVARSSGGLHRFANGDRLNGSCRGGGVNRFRIAGHPRWNRASGGNGMKEARDRPPSLEPGQLVRECRITALLGRGGMGEVYLAEHIPLERPVAVKVLPPGAASPEAVERFLNEARLCSQIDHPNVVVIHDVGEQAGLHYIVMQLVRGRNLSELVREYQGPLPWRSSVRIIQLAAQGLHAVHERGLVHRDVKPSNIMLSVDSRVLLMDFGLVDVATERTLSGEQPLAGTPPYMSPEQCRGEKLNRLSDVFSLGSTLYYLLTGNAPYTGSTAAILAQIGGGQRPAPACQVNPAVPREVSDLVAKAMDPRREGRFPSAAAMAAELRSLLRRSLVADTTTWRQAKATTQPKQVPQPELPVVELLPLQTRWEKIQLKAPILLGAAAAMVLLALFGLLMGLGTETPQKPAASVAQRPGMVRIEEGYVQLGNEEAKLRRFLSSWVEDDQLEKVLTFYRAEPPERVHVPVFWIDRYEVTNAEYARFLRETGRTPPEHFDGANPPLGKEDHPVVDVTYDDADAYARWANKQLPTLQQWMRAFRGDRDWLFPWGDEYTPSRANVGDNPKYKTTSPVTATPEDVSPFQVYNLVGNASEFIRGAHQRDGEPRRVGKGAEYKMAGFVYGIGPCRFWYPLDGHEKGVGFRCVVESE